MDDLHFRKSIYADPQTSDDAIIEAINADPAKKKFAQDIDKLDKKIAHAMQIPVPDDLYNKLILRQTMESHQQQKKKTRVHLALAASVAFAVGLTFNFMQVSNVYTNMGDYALAHVNHEAKYFSNNDEAKVTLTSLNQKMATFNGSFAQELGKLIAANYCRFDGMKSLHLVFQGESSPITVFIIPQNDDLAFKASFAEKQLEGKSIRYKDANIIVVGDKKESLQKWQDNIEKNVRWSI
ncbi:MAG: hypothetical protein ACI9LM_003244 [Alteromonadaceae bacterium]|jgi:hypothetical protein